MSLFFKAVLFSLIVTGCTSTKAPDVVPSGPFKSQFPQQAWTDLALAAVQDQGLASLYADDAKSFCPNGMSNAHNWVHLLAAMAKYESDFDPNQVYKESFGVNSIGLLQLSVTDSAYGCAFSTEADVKDPAKNIQCAAKILKKWVASDEVISNSKNKGGARYWSTLRVTGKVADVKGSMRPWCE